MSGHEPIELREAIARVGRDLGMPEPGAIGALIAAWPELAGEPLARHSAVRSVRDGVVTVEVDDSAFATQLRYRETEVVAAAREVCGRAVVSSLRVVVSPSGKTRF